MVGVEASSSVGDGPISPEPVRSFDPDYLPAYVSNGVVGMRVLDIPFRRGVAVLNGLAGTHPVLQLEYAPHAPYPLCGDLAVGPASLTRLPHLAQPVEQRYDFGRGELHSRWFAVLEGVCVDAETLTFASRTHPSVVAQETVVQVDRPCHVRLAARVTVDGIPGRCIARRVPASEAGGVSPQVDGQLRFEPPGGLSSCGVALHTELVGADGAERRPEEWVGNGDLATSWAFDAVPGRPYVLRQLVSMVSEVSHPQPDMEATRLVGAAAHLGLPELRQRNAEEWSQLWKSRVRLVGAPRRWQAIADASFFYMHSAAHASSPASTHIFGMAQWYDYHYYYGHVMWDLDAFAVPVLALGQPGAAYALLEYRSRHRHVARQNARVQGRRGVQTPWEAGPSTGAEATPPTGLAVAYEDHGTLAVAHGFTLYSLVTCDRRFDDELAWPMLADAAEWILSRVMKTSRGYEIPEAMGVAERKEPHDNQAYMNIAARAVLLEAAAVARRTARTAPEAWEAVANQIVAPFDDAGKRIVTHDGFDPSEEKGATPEPPAALTLFGYPVDEATERETLTYYLDLAEDYIGSPMLSALYGVWAARLGDRQRSGALFEEGFGKFVSPRFMNIHEYREDKFPEQPVAGPFVANLAGFLYSCLYVLTRMRPAEGEPSEWFEPGPIVLPEGWEAIEVERLWVHGRPARLIACHGAERAELQLGPAEYEVEPR